MKKTLITLLALGSVAMGDSVTSSVSFTGGTNTYLAGSTFGDITLNMDMTTGTSVNGSIIFTPAVEALGNLGDKWLGAVDHTVSLWVETASLENDGLLFSMYTTNKTQTLGYYWNAANSTITFGRGTLNDSGFTFNNSGTGQQESSADLSSYFSSTDGLTNITIALNRGIDYYANSTATVWVNGKNAGTTNTFYTDMSGSAATNYVVGNATYGTIAITNQTLTTADQVKDLALVPEPTTATLSLLALCGLAARRRRR